MRQSDGGAWREGWGRQGTQEQGEGGKSEEEGYKSVGRQEGRDSDGESS